MITVMIKDSGGDPLCFVINGNLRIEHFDERSCTVYDGLSEDGKIINMSVGDFALAIENAIEKKELGKIEK